MTAPLRSLIVAMTTAVAVSSALAADLRWADFVHPTHSSAGAVVRRIALSEKAGDARIDAVEVAGGLLQVTGRLGDQHGSGWTTFGMDVAGNVSGLPVDMSAARRLRIRLAADTPQVLRLRLKGPDRRIQGAGCYPVMMQRVTTVPTDYEIPLEAFAAEGYCGELSATVPQTLAALTQVEVTANTVSPRPQVLRVGRIEFVDDVRAGDDEPGWTMAWSDEFNAGAGVAFDPARWSVGAGTAATFDGDGRLRVRGGASSRLQVRPAAYQLYGRVTARLQLPPGGRLVMSGVPLTRLPWPDGGEVVLLERTGDELVSGLRGPGLPMDGGLVRTAAGPDAAAFHTVVFDWEPDVMHWSVDGQRVRSVRRADIAPGTWQPFVSWPFAVTLEPGDGPLLVDHVRVFHRPALEAAAADALAAWQRGRRAMKDVEPARAAPPVRTAPSSAAAPVRQVVCERNHLGLMMCH